MILRKKYPPNSKHYRKMAFWRTKWSQFLESRSELAPDVVFRVEEAEKVGHIPAHKFLLAGASPVFRAQFYGPAKEHTALQ